MKTKKGRFPSRVMKAIVLFFIILLFTGIGYILGSHKRNTAINENKNPIILSPDILYLTQSIKQISGLTIEKVDNNSITVSLPLTPIDLPAKTLRYRVDITPGTQIFKPSFIPYILKQITPATPPQLKITDLEPGQTVTIDVKTDLRTLVTNQFEAERIQVIPTNSITGKITSISNKSLTVRGYPLSQFITSQRPEVSDYTSTLSPDTEISTVLQSGELKSFSLDQLTVGMQVAIYTDTDVTQEKSFSALLIQPIINTP